MTEKKIVRKEEKSISALLKTLTKVKKDLAKAVDDGNMKGTTEDMSIAEVASLQRKLQETTEMADVIKKKLQVTMDFIRYVRVPAVFEREDTEKATIAGIGTIYLLSDYNISVKKGQKEAAYEWLIEQGLGDIIKEAVNSSTLKATLKGVLAEGKEVPATLFNVSPFTRAQITK